MEAENTPRKQQHRIAAASTCWGPDSPTQDPAGTFFFVTLDKLLTVPQFPPLWNMGILAPVLLGEHKD